MTPYILKKHLTRKVTFFEKNDSRVPAELFSTVSEAPDLSDFPYPLPSAKNEYTCFASGNNSVVWYGGKTGVTRYDPNGEYIEDKIMYFSAHRHLPHHEVDAMLADGDNLWVLCRDKVAYIEMIMLTAEEKAEILLEETNKYVMRRGMVSQRELKKYRDYESRYDYASCDNDGLFTSGYAIGEMFRYATLKKKLGKDNPRTIDARKNATKACEACLLLMYIHGRPEGFIARSYHVTGEPVPNDGIFYKRDGKVAHCVRTDFAVRNGRAGEEIPCDYPIPDRLAALYRDLGYTDDDITYKADTSSDEVVAHFLQMKVAHDILGEDDPELDAIINDACKRTAKHIIDHGFEFCEYSGKPTTWAKWSKLYFESNSIGYADAPLNSSEMLAFLKITMHITGEKGIWQQAYDKLIADGYADLGVKHDERLFHAAMKEKCFPEEELMYGDNMLALMTYWMLCTLEEDRGLLEKYRAAFKSWSGFILREHTPGYDFMYKLGVPDAEIDFERDARWFAHFETNRILASVNSERHDVAVKMGRKFPIEQKHEISALLLPDERVVSKFDRNPYFLDNNIEKGSYVESCYVYTYSYWIGRYYGFIEEEGQV